MVGFGFKPNLPDTDGQAFLQGYTAYPCGCILEHYPYLKMAELF